MGSRARNSIRARVHSAKRFPRSRGRELPIEAAKQEPDDVMTHLHETRSIVLVATRALDELADPPPGFAKP